VSAFEVEDVSQGAAALCLVAELGVSEHPPADLARDVQLALHRTFGLTAKDIVFVRPGTLPLTSSGKVQRHRTRDLYRAGQLSRRLPVQ
jgi:acyl-CoA synthetase (AMP-forming)/AMP-acid ligase II